MMPPKPKTALNITTSAHKNRPPVPPVTPVLYTAMPPLSSLSPRRPAAVPRCPATPAMPPLLSPAVSPPPLCRPCCPVGGGTAAVIPGTPLYPGSPGIYG